MAGAEAQEVDSFWRGDRRPARAHTAPTRSARVSYRPIHSAYKEPRVAFLKQSLDDVLAVGGLARAGERRAIDGFRLRRLDRLRTDRGVKLKWNLGALSSVCNLDCEFCYRYGSPKEGAHAVPMMHGLPLLDLEEVDARLGHFHEGTGLFEASADLGEDFANPSLLEIYRRIRERAPDYCIDTTTHGGFLTADCVAELAKLKPIDLCVSLNSSNPEIRRRLMKDRDPEIAIRSIELLRDAGIRFSVSIVAWPTVPLADLESTVRYSDRFAPRAIRIQLPGHSRFHPTRIQYDRAATWRSVVSVARRLRRSCRSPIYWQPCMYDNDPLTPAVSGVIPGSPAADVGLRPDDVILEVDGVPVGSRDRANRTLARTSLDDDRRSLVLRRGDSTCRVDLVETEAHRARHPYAGEGYSPLDSRFGLMINDGLCPASVLHMVRRAQALGARRALVLSSPLMESAVASCLSLVQAKLGAREVDFRLKSPAARFFGGNIILGDLLTVSDFAAAVEEQRAEDTDPDVVFVPSTPFEAGRDLAGVPFHELERRTGVRTVVVPHPRILD
jgi:hypothetical protein